MNKYIEIDGIGEIVPRSEYDALAAQVEKLKSELRQEKLIHIGFTNESQIQYVTEDKDEGTFYPNSDHGCYIPVYMLNVHAHRVGSESKIYCTQLEQGKNLAEVRADAIEQAVNETKKLESTPCGQWWYCYVEDLKKYADSIRQGEVK